jgi:hypothetical protein
LPPAVLGVVARHDFFAWLHRLQTGNSEESQAWRRLAGPERPLSRWCGAFLLNQARWPELELLHALDQKQPELIEYLNPANVAWWRRFAQRPRFGAMSFAVALMISMFAALFFSAEQSSAGDRLAWLRVTALLLSIYVGLELVRIYLIEWPIILTRRWWPEEPPRWFAGGWLADCLTLPMLAALASGFPGLSWTFATFAVLTALWAAIVAGPTGKKEPTDAVATLINRSRLVCIVWRNLWVGIWVLLMALEYPAMVELPLIVAIMASLAASALAADEQIHAMQSRLTPRTRLFAEAGVMVMSVAMIWVVLSHRDVPEWQPIILAGTVTCLLLQRCFLMTRVRILRTLMGIGVLVHLGLKLYDGGHLVPVSSVADGTWPLWGGALVLLSRIIVIMLIYHSRDASAGDERP